MNLRDQILAAPDIETQEIYVPEWGCNVHLRSWTAAEREEWEGKLAAAKKTGAIRAMTAAFSCRDEEGNLLFDDRDIPALAAKHSGALRRIYETMHEMSSVDKDDVDALEGN